MDLRYQILINDRLIMAVVYISDAAWFLADRISVGQRITVVDLWTGKKWQNPTATQIVDEFCASSNSTFKEESHASAISS